MPLSTISFFVAEKSEIKFDRRVGADRYKVMCKGAKKMSEVQKKKKKSNVSQAAGSDLYTMKRAWLVGCTLQVHDVQVEVQWTYHHCLGGMPWPWWSCSRGRLASTKHRMDTSACMSTTRLEECTLAEDNPFFFCWLPCSSTCVDLRAGLPRAPPPSRPPHCRQAN